jgi:hypothetical protein
MSKFPNIENVDEKLAAEYVSSLLLSEEEMTIIYQNSKKNHVLAMVGCIGFVLGG